MSWDISLPKKKGTPYSILVYSQPKDAVFGAGEGSTGCSHFRGKTFKGFNFNEVQFTLLALSVCARVRACTCARVFTVMPKALFQRQALSTREWPHSDFQRGMVAKNASGLAGKGQVV